MNTHELLFYIPTAIISIIAAAFLALWRLSLASSWQWAAGFALTASGFALSSFPIEPTFDQLTSGFLFIGAAYCYGSATLIHFRAGSLRRVQVGLVIAFVVPHIHFVLIEPSLRSDLFLIEMTFALMLVSVLVSVFKRAANGADTFLLLATALVTIDCLVRGFVFTFIYPTSVEMSDFVHSAYNISVHVTTITLCLLFPLAAFSAMAFRAVDDQRRAAACDPLTGLLNRRGFDMAVRETKAVKEPSGSVVLLDIDHFKRINDSLGHAAGDEVIVEVARRLKGLSESRVTIGRFGGEEFIVFIDGASEQEASAWAETARASLKDGGYIKGLTSAVTASFGVCAVGATNLELDTAIQQADKALYAAKLSGRDRVVCASALLLSTVHGGVVPFSGIEIVGRTARS